MKLVFKKDEDLQIEVLQIVEGKEQKFSYLDMIHSLIESGNLEPAEVSDGFTEAEVNSISSMVNYINQAAGNLVESDEEGETDDEEQEEDEDDELW